VAGTASASPLAQHRTRRSADARRQSVNQNTVYPDGRRVNTVAVADPQTALTPAGEPRRAALKWSCSEVIDRDHLAHQAGQDADLQREVLLLFLQQMEELRRFLASGAMGNENVSAVVTALHRYRGAALAVGAGSLAAALAAAETDPWLAGAVPGAGETLMTVVHATTDAARHLIATLPLAGLAKEGETN
jgi:HPt (histidine-containing phosphotransfer) domain-containing protein